MLSVKGIVLNPETIFFSKQKYSVDENTGFYF